MPELKSALLDELRRVSAEIDGLINVAHARTAIASVPGEVVAMSKSQYAQLLCMPATSFVRSSATSSRRSVRCRSVPSPCR